MTEKIQRAVDVAAQHPVTHRHAKCKNCDERFRYHRSAAEDNNGHRPHCPNCDEQGIGGPFGRVNPAEYLGIIVEAAEGTPFEYRHWLANEAVMHADYRDEQESWLSVRRADYLPCAITQKVSRHMKEGGELGLSRSGGWSPHVYARYLQNGVEMNLVGVDDLDDEVREKLTDIPSTSEQE